MAQALVTAKLMADVAMEFNIGADLLSKSNRSIDKYLGAEKKSGDTVYVPIMDSGEVFDNLDLTNPQAAGKLAPDRDEVPVTVSRSSPPRRSRRKTLLSPFRTPRS